MLNRRFAFLAVPAVISGLLLGLAACASGGKTTTTSASKVTPTHAEISNEVTATANVVALDKALRLVTLRGEDGRLAEIHAGDAVRNFDQIAVGDELRVHYRQALEATLLPPGSDPKVTQAGLVAGRAEKGAQPGAAIGARISVRVKIVSVDSAREVVVFSLPSGELIARQIATPEGREFVKGLKIGDLVQLDFSEALALSIEPMKSAG